MTLQSKIDHLDTALDHEISAADLAADREIKRDCLRQIARLHFSREMSVEPTTKRALEVAFHVSASAIQGRPSLLGRHIIEHPRRDDMIRRALMTLQAHPRRGEGGIYSGIGIAEAMLRNADLSALAA